MTAIKCKAIRSTAHMKTARDYVEDERQLDSWTLNITCPEKWEQEMSMARTAYGHDASGREGTRPTYAFHMVIAFNPDECIQHGGPIGPGEAMAYAERYISESFPHCQAKMTLHEEGGDATPFTPLSTEPFSTRGIGSTETRALDGPSIRGRRSSTAPTAS